MMSEASDDQCHQTRGLYTTTCLDESVLWSVIIDVIPEVVLVRQHMHSSSIYQQLCWLSNLPLFKFLFYYLIIFICKHCIKYVLLCYVSRHFFLIFFHSHPSCCCRRLQLYTSLNIFTN